MAFAFGLRCLLAISILSCLVSKNVASDLAVLPAKLSGERQDIELPGKISSMCVAADGRLLVFWIPEKKQAAVFDVVELKVVKLLPFNGDEVLLAGGKFHLALADAPSRKISVIDLRTYAEVVTKKLAGDAPFRAIAMGRNSLGPLMVIDGDVRRDRLSNSSQMVAVFFETQTLEKMPIEGYASALFNSTRPTIATATPDGRIFCAQEIGGGSTNDMRWIMLPGSVEAWGPTYGYQSDDTGKHFFDLKGIYTTKGGYVINLAGNWSKWGPPLPALSGPLVIRAATHKHRDGTPTPVYLQAGHSNRPRP